MIGTIEILITLENTIHLKKKYNLENKNIFITGGGSGIGGELTDILAKNNNLLITFFKSKKNIFYLTKNYSKNISSKKVNFNKKSEIIKSANIIKKKFKNIDTVIFNALIPTKRKKFTSTSINEIENNLKKNFLSNVLYTKELIKIIKKQKNLCLFVHISSNVAKYGGWGLSNYAPIKAANDNFFRGIEKEFFRKIKFISIKLGPVKTKGYIFTNAKISKNILDKKEAAKKIISIINKNSYKI